jgi:DNA-binding GntR family transcriptional regulator
MRKKLSEELREAIEEKIVFGAWPPGMRLDEAELAGQFGVSRTPLREALIQLASLGIVEIRPHRGAVVASLEPQRLVEMFEVMAELEAMCARLASRRITPEELARLRAAHHECSEQAQHAEENAYYYANERFHAIIYEASHNTYLAEQAAQLHRRLRVYRRLQLRARGRLASSFDEHAGVVEAIASGDAERAAARLRDHVQVQGDRFTDLLASLQWRAAA